MCNRFCRPNGIVEGDGFKRPCISSISIGATNGNIENVDEVLPCATTVSRHLSNVVTAEKEHLIKRLEFVKQFGVTTDPWDHQHTNGSDVTVTAQYTEDANG